MVDVKLRRELDILTEGEDAEVPRWLRAEAIDIRKVAAPWISGRGIQGVGIAPRVTQGELQDEMVLKVYVEKNCRSRRSSMLSPVKSHIPVWELPWRPMWTRLARLNPRSSAVGSGPPRPALASAISVPQRVHSDVWCASAVRPGACTF